MECCGVIDSRYDMAGNRIAPFCEGCGYRHHFSPELSAASSCFGAGYYVAVDVPVRPRFIAERVGQ